MAFVRNPKTGEIVKATKKGKNSKGDKQIWIDSNTKTRFMTELGAENNVNQDTGNAIADNTELKLTKTAPVKNEVKISTIIKVNGQTIKTVPSKITKEQAFDLCKDYFKEISMQKCTETKDTTGNSVIQFVIRTGEKG